MPINQIILVVIVTLIALFIMNFLFESFKILLNIIVILGLVIWVLYALGMIPAQFHL